MRHYEVLSPEMTHYRWSDFEPPEVYQHWGVFLAKNAKDAIRQAVAAEEFQEWVQEARGDNVPPFKGLTTRRCLCEHGVCWACGSEEQVFCGACEKAFQAEDDGWMCTSEGESDG
jgi:hypothetical protein